MDPYILNNLYLVGGLLAAMFVIVWRLTASSQKAIQYSVDSLQLQINSLADRMESGFTRLDDRLDKVDDRLDKVDDRLDKVDDRLEKMDDRVRDLQMDMAVVKDRLNIQADDRTASPAAGRAGSPAPQATAAEA